ncbi:MAG: FtsX-like permease family protein [Candidatus Thermoplasmatota archaeon]|nr:FtsX-like permease family protein [Candidatus Thermoplasmatota archaeon]
MIGRTFNPASYAISHLRHGLFRSLTTVATLSITLAFAILTSSMLLGVTQRIDEDEGLLRGNIPGSIDMFSEFNIDPELSEEARSALLHWMFLTTALVLIVAFFIVYNTMAMSVEERRAEIGVLRAIGFSTAEVLRIFLIEGGMIGIISWTVALFLGMPFIVNLAAYLISKGDGGLFFVQPVIDLPLAALSLAVSVGLCLISTYLASIRRIRKPPVDTMRPAV